MTKLIWNESGSHLYEAGVDRGVFYPKVGPGISWNGLLSVKENVADSGQRITYVDGQKLRTQIQLGIFVAEVSAITYPREFESYDGTANNLTAQQRKAFNLSYRTKIGNDVLDSNLGYKINLVYNALAMPTTRDYSTLDGGTKALEFTWSLETTPVLIPGMNPTSHLIIDTTKAYPSTIIALEDILYGGISSSPRIPTIDEVFTLFEANAIFRVTDNGDGTATITGPDTAVNLISSDTVELTWDSVVQLDIETYMLSSL